MATPGQYQATLLANGTAQPLPAGLVTGFLDITISGNSSPTNAVGSNVYFGTGSAAANVTANTGQLLYYGTNNRLDSGYFTLNVGNTTDNGTRNANTVYVITDSGNATLRITGPGVS